MAVAALHAAGVDKRHLFKGRARGSRALTPREKLPQNRITCYQTFARSPSPIGFLRPPPSRNVKGRKRRVMPVSTLNRPTSQTRARESVPSE